ncbi:sugar transporter [Roseovarius sp. M141]|nr:sugar transporter [Roseovarius sp. M141]
MKVKVIEVLRPAQAAYLRLRHKLILASFVLCVLIPAAVSGIYLYARAVDQYASKVGFTVRREEVGSAMEILGGMTSLSAASSSDTDILYEFIQSQELVREIDRQLDLVTIYSKPEKDFIYRLDPDASIEDKMDYWARMVRIYYAGGTGLIEVEVRAFDPQDAHRIATALFDLSSQMINDLSNVARADAARYAREELEQAVQRLKSARQALTLFRNETQIVDPSADIQGRMGLLNSLQAQLAEALIDADLLANTTRDSDPRVELANRRINVIQNRIAGERQKMGARALDGSDVLPPGEKPVEEVYADLIGTFESLSVDLEFAEKAYISAQSAYDTALAEARRQSRYLAAYMRPTVSETPRYPDRGLTLLVISLILFGVWTISVLIYYSLKDRR